MPRVQDEARITLDLYTISLHSTSVQPMNLMLKVTSRCGRVDPGPEVG
jgi:hypothetical protein